MEPAVDEEPPTPGFFTRPISRRAVLATGAAALIGGLGAACSTQSEDTGRDVGSTASSTQGAAPGSVAAPSATDSQAPPATSGTGPGDTGPGDTEPAPEAVSDAALDFQYPLAVAPSGVHLVDQAGRPFRIQGDAAWSLITNLTIDEVEEYLDDRRSKGFNSVLVNLIEHKFAVNAPANRQGDEPFTSPGDFSTPNDDYFDFAEEVLDAARDRGIVVFLTYLYLGHLGGEGWSDELASDTNSESSSYEYGRFVGERFGEYDNIVWVAGGDARPLEGTVGLSRLRTMQQGLRDAGAAQLATAHWDPGLSTDVSEFLDDLQLNAVYWYGRNGDGHTYDAAHSAAEYEPTLPAFLIETGYEETEFIPGDPASIRKYEYWAQLSGATAGGFFGQRDIWEFATEEWKAAYHFGSRPWQESLDTPGAFDFQRLGQVLDSVPWFRLVPQEVGAMGRLIVSDDGERGRDDYVAAAATEEGDALIAYIPDGGDSPRTIDVDLATMQGSLVAEWFDPTTGQVVDAGPVDAGATVSFTTPGENGAGESDWVLRIVGNG